ncbi:MAG: hypothetical protein ACK56I_36580, partial [bacterium]
MTSVSIERIRDECIKIMLHENRVRGFDLLVNSGLMQHILPEILALQGCEQPPQQSRRITLEGHACRVVRAEHGWIDVHV